MPWWSWVVIWTVLVLGLLAMLAFFAWSLFRKLMRAAHEATALIEKTDVLAARTGELHEAGFHPAIFADPQELAAGREQVRADRATARQARRDARVRRGKLLVKADALRYAYLTQRN